MKAHSEKLKVRMTNVLFILLNFRLQLFALKINIHNYNSNNRTIQTIETVLRLRLIRQRP
jgi:hypothetical protein